MENTHNRKRRCKRITAKIIKWAVSGQLAIGLSTGLFVMDNAEARALHCTNGYVALTFDDGPNSGNTGKLLQVLKENDLRATFFNIGQKAQKYPSLVRNQLEANMWIGNHSWSHPHMTQLTTAQNSEEITKTQQTLQSITGREPKLFRPPYGETDSALKELVVQNGLTEVIWDVDSQDWNGATTDQIVAAANRLQNGDVILMHDEYQTTLQAIPLIAQNLKSRGLCSGMISPSTGRAVAPDDSSDPTTHDISTIVEADYTTNGSRIRMLRGIHRKQ